jgi:hypothetical protein
MSSKTHTELIKHYIDVSRGQSTPLCGLVHLSKSLITQFIQMPQLYAFGNNIGGRPDGIWVAPGDSWLHYVTATADPEYSSYRYLYDVNIEPQYRSEILIVTADNFAQFDAECSSYWLNFDYFNVDINDVVSGRKYVYNGGLKFNFSELRKKSLNTMYDILLDNGIIFNNIKAARDGCSFYSKMGDTLIERFKYKDWHSLSKKYCGIYFPDYSKSARHIGNKYFWYQTLDIPSGCIWDKKAFNMRLRYEFGGDGWTETSN